MKYYIYLIITMNTFFSGAVYSQGAGNHKINLSPYSDLVNNNWKGVVWEPFNRDWNSAGTTSDGEQIVDCGIKWARVWVNATRDFTQMDAMVKQCKAQNIQIILCYNKTNPLHDLGDSIQQAEQVSLLKDYVRRYKNDIRYWEIQNEANLNMYWNVGKEVGRGSGDANSPYNAGVHRFVKWLQLSYNAIKEVDPGKTVILGGISEWIMEDFMDRLTVEHAYNYFDEVGFHPYPTVSNPNPDQCIGRLKSFKNKMSAWPEPKNDMPIWITEIGFHTGSITSPGTVNDETIKADYLKETMQKLIQNLHYSRPVCWYIFHEVNANNTYFALLNKKMVDGKVVTNFLPSYFSFKGLGQNWKFYKSIPSHPVALGETKKYTCLNWDKFKSSGPALKQIGWLATKSSKEIKSSPWSVGCETIDRDFTKFNNYKDYVGELGVKGARLQSGWAKCEKKKGKYTFEWLDSCVYGLVKQDVKPWISLSYGNPVYKSDLNIGGGIFTDDVTMKAWLKWVSATVTRYKDVVNEWEIWNEPNQSKEYANLLIKTAETIRKIQPAAVIMGFSLSGNLDLKFTKEVFETLKANNKLALVDYLTYHPYNYNPDDNYAKVDTLKAMILKYNSTIKLFQGENGAPSDNHYVYHALQNYPWTEISQAKWYLRRMAGDRVRDIRSCVFSIIDIRYDEVLLSMGLLRSNLRREVLYRKPAYYAVQHMVSIFDDVVKPISFTTSQKQTVTGTVADQGEQSTIMEYKSDASRAISLARFEKEGKPVILIWYNDKIPGDDFKWDLTDLLIMNMVFHDPVYVEMISGKVYEIDKSNWELSEKNVRFKKLPVWDSPMMIAERSQVKLGTGNEKN